MPSTIILNQSNIVPDGKNSSLVYRFPNSVSFPHHEIAIQSIAMYYSWENINALPLANNTFSITWRVGSANATVSYLIPNGLYEVSDLNKFLQFTFIQAGQYLISPTGQNVYFAEWLINANRYAVQLNTFPVPTEASGGFTVQPDGSYLGTVAPWVGYKTPLADTAGGTSAWVGFSDTVFNPSITIPNNLNKILGFTVPNPYVSPLNLGTGTNFSALSNVAPQVQPNSSAYLSISNIANKYSIPSSVIYSITPQVAFGEQIIEQPPQFAWNKLLNGTYNEIRLQILGIDYQALTILDPNMTIVLVIRDTKDLGLQDLVSYSSGGK